MFLMKRNKKIKKKTKKQRNLPTARSRRNGAEMEPKWKFPPTKEKKETLVNVSNEKEQKKIKKKRKNQHIPTVLLPKIRHL
jgi:hypothetical protein